MPKLLNQEKTCRESREKKFLMLSRRHDYQRTQKSPVLSEMNGRHDNVNRGDTKEGL